MLSKRWIRFLGFLYLLGVFWFFPDEAPYRPELLQMQREAVPKGENGYYELLSAIDSLHLEPPQARLLEERIYDRKISLYSPKERTQLLTDNVSALEQMETYLKKRKNVWPERFYPDSPAFDRALNSYSPSSTIMTPMSGSLSTTVRSHHLFLLKQLQTAVFVQQGDIHKAYEGHLASIQFVMKNTRYPELRNVALLTTELKSLIENIRQQNLLKSLSSDEKRVLLNQLKALHHQLPLMLIEATRYESVLAHQATIAELYYAPRYLLQQNGMANLFSKNLEALEAQLLENQPSHQDLLSEELSFWEWICPNGLGKWLFGLGRPRIAPFFAVFQELAKDIQTLALLV